MRSGTRYWNDGRRPVLWCVDKRYYGSYRSWDALHITPDWLVTTKSGDKVLYMEADATSEEDALAMGLKSKLFLVLSPC